MSDRKQLTFIWRLLTEEQNQMVNLLVHFAIVWNSMQVRLFSHDPVLQFSDLFLVALVFIEAQVELEGLHVVFFERSDERTSVRLVIQNRLDQLRTHGFFRLEEPLWRLIGGEQIVKVRTLVLICYSSADLLLILKADGRLRWRTDLHTDRVAPLLESYSARLLSFLSRFRLPNDANHEEIVVLSHWIRLLQKHAFFHFLFL